MKSERNPMMLKRIILGFFTAFVMLMCPQGNTALAQDATSDLMELSLEELMNISVTSVSKKEQMLFEAAAAIFAITADDIRRSGVTSIPEALRMVPGMQVAHIDANKWAISARGFNFRFAGKALGFNRWPQCLYTVVLRRILGCPGLDAGRHRSH